MNYIAIINLKHLSIDIYKDTIEVARTLGLTRNVLNTKLNNSKVFFYNHSFIGYAQLHASNRGKGSTGRTFS